VKEWFDEHESEVEHLPWPEQSPDLNIFKPHWDILEKQVRKLFPFNSITVAWPLFWKRSGSKSLWPLYRTFSTVISKTT